MKKERIFAILGSNGMQSAPDIHFAINKFNKFKNALGINRMSAVVELDEKNNIMRYITSNIEYGFEVCPHCGGTSIMHSEFRAQHCTECGKVILPCNLCDDDFCKCSKCPLKSLKNRKYIGGIKPSKTEK